MNDTTAVATGTNDTRYNDLLAVADQLGAGAGEHKDALPKLALYVLRAANDGYISTTKPKDGPDAAEEIFNRYTASAAAKAMHDRTDGGVKANVSKLRQIINMGAMTTCDPVDVMNRAVAKRQELMATDQKVKPAYAAYVDIAREQLKTDTDMTDEHIESVVRKEPTKDKTLEDMLEGVQKTLEKVVTGENAHGVKTNSERVIKAYELIREELAALYHYHEVSKAKALLAAEADKANAS